MNWIAVTCFAACGGAIVSIVTFSADVLSWRQARRIARASLHRRLPPFTQFVDLYPDSLVLVTRMSLGALSGWLLQRQIAGLETAIAVGAATPALLSQLDTSRTFKEAAIHDGTDSQSVTSIQASGPQPTLPEES